MMPLLQVEGRGFSFVFLLTGRGVYAFLKKALDEAETKMKALEEERNVAKATVGKATKELLLVKEALETTTSECARLQKAHAESLDAVKSLQK